MLMWLSALEYGRRNGGALAPNGFWNWLLTF